MSGHIAPNKIDRDAAEPAVPAASPGNRTSIVAYLYPSFDEAGRVALVAMTGEDVTARIEAEAQLRGAEEQYRGIFEATGEGLIIVEANPASWPVCPQPPPRRPWFHAVAHAKDSYWRSA